MHFGGLHGVGARVMEQGRSALRAVTAASTRHPHTGLPSVIAHRGGWGTHIQNSPAQLRDAVRQGAGGVEFDIRRTLDGVLVVHHDPHVGSTLIGKTPFVRLPRLEDGSAVPTFDDVLDAVGRRTVLNVELKEAGYARQVLDTLDAHHIPNRQLAFSSFDLEAVKGIKELRPEARVGYLTSPAHNGGLAAIETARRNGMDFVVASTELPLRETVAAARTARLPLLLYSPWKDADAARSAELLRNRGIAGLIVNEVRPAAEARVSIPWRATS